MLYPTSELLYPDIGLSDIVSDVVPISELLYPDIGLSDIVPDIVPDIGDGMFDIVVLSPDIGAT